MATTRIIPMHVNKGKTIQRCLTDRINYAENPEKTEYGELISSFACAPESADAQFLFSKRQYKSFTGRTQENDVIAYQIRQSFVPGEITPEEANRIGYEFAQRFLKGKHAFSLVPLNFCQLSFAAINMTCVFLCNATVELFSTASPIPKAR